MTAVAAEREPVLSPSLAPVQSMVLPVPELQHDRFTRAKASRFIGDVLANNSVELVQNPGEFLSLEHATHEAAHGNEMARAMIWDNAMTEASEQIFKSGHIMNVYLTASEYGVAQHDQSMDNIQVNSLLLASDMPQIRARTNAETNNSFRVEDSLRAGYLEEHNLVFMSRAADDMSEKDMKRANFFVETMSCSIQVISLAEISPEGESKLHLQSAFVAGKTSPESERHDAETIVKMGKNLGVDLSNKTATELIDTPLLIHKSLMPNGVIDLVKMYDDATGLNTFFGEAKPREDYHEYQEKCVERTAKLKPTVDKIVAQLIAEHDSIKGPVEAIERLHKITEDHMVENAVEDTTIDLRVFGKTSANHIEQVRYHQAMGNFNQAQNYLIMAKATAETSSCPSALKKNATDSILSSKVDQMREALGLSKKEDEESDGRGSLYFDCPKGHRNKRPHGELIENCQVCGTSVRCD